MPTYEYRSLKAKVLLSYCATPECRVTATSICFVFMNWYVQLDTQKNPSNKSSQKHKKKTGLK